jgi:hypothetical protein
MNSHRTRRSKWRQPASSCRPQCRLARPHATRDLHHLRPWKGTVIVISAGTLFPFCFAFIRPQRPPGHGARFRFLVMRASADAAHRPWRMRWVALVRLFLFVPCPTTTTSKHVRAILNIFLVFLFVANSSLARLRCSVLYNMH